MVLKMADSPALRARRYRQHRQGDHSLCRHDRPLRLAPAAPAGPAEPGQDFDPAAELRALAARLADAYAEDPSNAAVARELRLTLLAIDPPAVAEWDPIQELQHAEWESRQRERDLPEF
jgi:hypothetical protein